MKNLNISQKNILENNQKENITQCKSCISNFWCFRCIGKNKESKNYGACKNTQECSYYQKLTEKTLNKFSELINKNLFIELSNSCNELIKSSL